MTDTSTVAAVETSDTAVYSPFIEADANASAEELRAGMKEHGYLFFRALVPGDEVLAVRRAALELCREAGWLDPTRDLMEGVVGPGVQPTVEGRPDYMVMYRQLLRTPRFYDFPTQEPLMQIAFKLLGEEALVHPRRIGRVTFPAYTIATTPAHQDHFYIRGAVDTYSCWIPLGECPMNLGGLSVMPGSHKKGFIEHTEHIAGAVGGRGVPVSREEDAWHASDFGLGDALFFHSYTIHKALPNLTADRLRISTDNRYQRPKEDIDPGALREHFS